MPLRSAARVPLGTNVAAANVAHTPHEPRLPLAGRFRARAGSSVMIVKENRV
jgi:hypothetical protein